jgi:hypothetical protein
LTSKNKNLRKLAANLCKAPHKEVVVEANSNLEAKTDKEAAVITTSQEVVASTSQEVVANAVVVEVALQMKRRNNTKSVKTAVTVEAVSVAEEAEVLSLPRN